MRGIHNQGAIAKRENLALQRFGIFRVQTGKILPMNSDRYNCINYIEIFGHLSAHGERFLLFIPLGFPSDFTLSHLSLAIPKDFCCDVCNGNAKQSSLKL